MDSHMVIWCVVWIALSCTCINSVSLLKRRHRQRHVIGPDAEDDAFQLPPAQWFIQRLDHFQPADSQTWKQRYWMKNDFYKAGGPAFLMISGEGAASAYEMLPDQPWAQYANEQKAAMFYIEHRFYGESLPTSDLSLGSLKYLSSEQALADSANFIDAMNREHKLPKGTKWIVFGGSYAGNLAAWLRYKYPHLVYGAVASSAPVLAKVDFKGYFSTVQDSLETFGGKSCVTQVKRAYSKIDFLLKSCDGRKRLEELFDLEAIDLVSPEGVADMFRVLSFSVAEVVQGNKYVADEGKWEINIACDILKDDSLGDVVDRYAALYERGSQQNEEIVEDERPWNYQACLEFGYFTVSGTNASLLGNRTPLKFMITSDCLQEFGNTFNESYIRKAVDHTNMMYGGQALAATRVIYVHGSIDPWHTLGITHSRMPESPVIFINGTSHCADMYGPDESDPPALTDARMNISRIIKEWVTSTLP